MYTIFIIPVMMLLIGYLMFKYPPKKINFLIGYRTRASMKNERVWKEANQYFGILLIKYGCGMLAAVLLFSVLVWLKTIAFTEFVLIIIVLVQVIVIVITALQVDKKIRNL